MTTMTLIQAVTDALRTEMREDKDVVVFGEDVGKNGGVFRATDGLQAEFGEERVFDTPLAEGGIIGTAIGMALYGLKPVPEIQFQDFIFPAFDQIVSEAAKIRYRSGGQYNVPMTIRTPYGGGIRGGHYHSQSGEAYFAHTPGLKVVIPSTPHDAKGLLISSIRDPDPTVFMEPKRVYRAIKEDVPDGAYTVPLGKARLAREGQDLSILTYGAMVHVALEAAKQAEQEGISVEVVDLRTLLPFDGDAILKSVKKTGRAMSVVEAPKIGSFAGEINAFIAENAIEYLQAPLYRVAGFDTPFPYTLEHDYMPTTDRILHFIRKSKAY
ncbi:MAG: pyruvate dehydrogenase component beta subunit [Thermoplasmata archaeon]|jgi:2-oxoisovalerate dehydrogenase E1 component beta subunit|nr:pyruvate dehydrogenase component beta subunit [Thermoplasmata archaeon]